MTQLQCRYLQRSLCQEGFGLIDSLPTLWAFRPSMKLLLCLINNSGFVEGGGPSQSPAGSWDPVGHSNVHSPPELESHLWKGDRGLRLLGQEPGKAEPGDTIASLEARPGSIFKSEASQGSASLACL